MKSMENDDDDNNNNNNNTNWLGFSLSPHITMDGPPSSAAATVSAAVPTSFFHSPPHLNYGAYYEPQGENAGFYSPLSVMPLKSDGSLCIMEALTRSQPQG